MSGGGHALSPGAARLSSRSDDGGRGCGGGRASDTTSGVCGDSSGFVPLKKKKKDQKYFKSLATT